jgi:hypothetical protein
MIEVLFLFPRDADLAAADEILADGLIPRLTNATGVRSVRMSQDAIMGPGGPPPYARVVEASFDTLADWMAVVDVSKNAIPTRERALRPLILFFDVSEQSLPNVPVS